MNKYINKYIIYMLFNLMVVLSLLKFVISSDLQRIIKTKQTSDMLKLKPFIIYFEIITQ